MEARSTNANRPKLVIAVAFLSLLVVLAFAWPDGSEQIQTSGADQGVSDFLASDALRASEQSTGTAEDAPPDGAVAFVGAIPETDLDANEPAGLVAGNDGGLSNSLGDQAETNETGRLPSGDDTREVSQVEQTGTTSRSPSDQSAPAPTTAEQPASSVPLPSPTSTPSSTGVNPTAVPVDAPLGQLTGTLYVDPNNAAANWANNNPDHEFTDVIRERIALVPTAAWFGDWNTNISADVSNYVDAARNTGSIPIVVAYNIPNRDCGQYSSGGAPNHAAYADWIEGFSEGLGSGEAIVILEPDSLALGQCLDRNRTLSVRNAVDEITDRCSQCRVYLDAGHSAWVPASEMASRLETAGVFNASGFFTNVSNYHPTANETAFGQQVLSELGNPDGLGQMIDTSRNGNGSSSAAEWCDQESAALGANPTLQTQSSTVHGHLWIKVPGESDGCLAPAGMFLPEEAVRLATN